MPNPKRLLFVDDEDGIRATLPLILQGHGFNVESAGSVPDALQKIEHDKFDVLVSDLNIAEPQDGFAVVRAMREVNPGCIAVVLTGYPGFDSAVEGIRLNIDDYFVKPADVDSLVAAIHAKFAERKQAQNSEPDPSEHHRGARRG
jgi:DNA-binding NtrC family response regulator